MNQYIKKIWWEDGQLTNGPNNNAKNGPLGPSIK